MLRSLDILAERLEARGHADLAGALDRIADVVARRPALVRRSREDDAREALEVIRDELEDVEDHENLERLDEELDTTQDQLQRYGPRVKPANEQRPIDPVYVDDVGDTNYVSKATRAATTTNVKAAASLPLLPEPLRGLMIRCHQLEAKTDKPVVRRFTSNQAALAYRALRDHVGEEWGVGRVVQMKGDIYRYESDAGELTMRPSTSTAGGWVVGYTSDTERVGDE